MANDLAVGAINSANTANAASGIGLEDFLKILTSQLNNQDPLKPVDNQEFIAQMAQFSALEQSRQLNEKIDQLLSVQSTVQSVAMLGRTVEFESAGATLAGQVKSINFAAGGSLMSVLTEAGTLLEGIGLSQIVTIR